MLEPPQRRKPATELEVKLARGDPTANDALIALLDTVLHKDLQVLYPTRLPDDERARIVTAVIADFIQGKVKYDVEQSSIETLAKNRAKWRAKDYFRRVRVAEAARPNLVRREELLRAVEKPEDVLIRFEDLAARADMVERLIIEIEQLPQNHRLAALAYMRHGESDPDRGGKAYSTILAEDLGVEPGRVAQWWCRARKRLVKALEREPKSCIQRSMK
jgi:hypothetical protein